MVCVALIAFAFGGCCASVFPALTADNFGTRYMGLNYGCGDGGVRHRGAGRAAFEDAVFRRGRRRPPRL
jgi:hypothetical protein